MIRSVCPPGCEFPFVAWHDGIATFTTQSIAPDGPVWAVVVFVTDGDRFVIGKVPRGWCTPSGHVEAGEALETTALREVYEEAGATVRDLRRIGTFLIITRRGSVEGAAVFHARLDRLAAVPDWSESDGAQVAALDRLPKLYWRWDPLMQSMFEYVLKLVKTQSMKG